MVTVELISLKPLAVFALATTAWFAICFALARLTERELVKRMIWRTSIAGVLGLCLLESAGVSEWIYCCATAISKSDQHVARKSQLTLVPTTKRTPAKDPIRQTTELRTAGLSRPLPVAYPSTMRLDHEPSVVLSPPRQVDPVSTSPSPTGRGGLGLWAIGVWGLGTALLLLHSFGSHIATWCFWLRRCKPAPTSLRDRIARLTTKNSRRPPRIYTTPRIGSPLAMGVIRPCIVVPSAFEADFSRRQQDAVLTHELRHIRDRDPLWRLVASLGCAAIWWQPLAWIARRRLQASTELVADEAAFQLQGGPEALAESLVQLGKLWQRTPRTGLAAATGKKSDLGRRVERLLDEQGPIRSPAWVSGAVRIVLVIGLLVAVGTTGWSRNTGNLDLGEEEMTTIHSTFRRSILGASLVFAVGLPTSADTLADEQEVTESRKQELKESRTEEKPGVRKEKPKDHWGNKKGSFGDKGHREFAAETRKLSSKLKELSGDNAKQIQQIVKQIIAIEQMKIEHKVAKHVQRFELDHEAKIHQHRQELRMHQEKLEKRHDEMAARALAEQDRGHRRKPAFFGNDAPNSDEARPPRPNKNVSRQPDREIEARMSRLEEHFTEIHKVLHDLTSRIEDGRHGDRHRDHSDHNEHRGHDGGHDDHEHDGDHDHNEADDIFGF